MSDKIKVSSGTGKDIKDIESGRIVPVDGDIKLPNTQNVLKRIYNGDYIRKDVRPEVDHGQPVALPENISVSIPDGKSWDDLTELERNMFLSRIR